MLGIAVARQQQAHPQVRQTPTYFSQLSRPVIRRQDAGAISLIMARKFPIHPGHPERICWGCEHFCPADDMRCGNGTERAHPIELWGDDWAQVGGGYRL
jgi:hypothetical protein